jgi:outer membrane immunogenic protein
MVQKHAHDHLFMGTALNLIPPFGKSGTHDINQDVDIATARLNYRFGGPVARC